MIIGMKMRAFGPNAATVLNRSGIVTDAVAGTSHTLAGFSIGAAKGSRRVLCFGEGFLGSGASNPTLDSATIGGVAATIIYQAGFYSAGSYTSRRFFIVANVPTGTTATVVLNWSASMGGAAAVCVSLDGLRSSSATDSDAVQASGGAMTVGTFDWPAGGYVCACGALKDTGNLTSWTTVTEFASTNFGGRDIYFADVVKATAATGQSIVANVSLAQQEGLTAISIR